MIQIQPFNSKRHLTSVKNLIYQSIDQCYPEFYNEKVVAYFKEYHSEENISERAEKGFTIVMYNYMTMVATGTLIGNYISSVYVLPKFQKKGMGKAIVIVLVKEAKKQGISILILDATAGSVDFYLKQGFTIDAEKIQMIDEIFPLPYTVMEKVF